MLTADELQRVDRPDVRQLRDGIDAGAWALGLSQCAEAHAMLDRGDAPESVLAWCLARAAE